MPSLWRPTVSIGGAFDIPSTWIDVSPFVGLMVDGNTHNIQFQASVVTVVDDPQYVEDLTPSIKRWHTLKIFGSLMAICMYG